MKRVPLDKYCEKKIETLQKNYIGLIDYIDISAVDNEEKRIISYQTIDSKDAPSRAKQLIKKNDILVSTVRPNLNAVAVIENETDNLMVASTGYCVLRCKDDADVRYMFNFCQSPYFIEDMTTQATGASYPAVSTSIVKSSLIPYYSIEEQHEIAKKIDAASNLIALRKQQLSKLDELVKSRFIEMFGDESKHHSVPLSESVAEMFIGPFGSSLKNECFVSADQGYCMVYEQKHAIRKTMDVETRYVEKQKYIELQRFTVLAGDIIVSCRGTIGETFVIPDEAPMGIMHPSIMKIRLKESAYNKVFFNYLLMNVLKQHEAEANGSGIKMAITATELGKELFIVPPMDLQRQFSAFVEQVDKSKFEIQKSLEKLETLKKALMQKYFG